MIEEERLRTLECLDLIETVRQSSAVRVEGG